MMKRFGLPVWIIAGVAVVLSAFLLPRDTAGQSLEEPADPESAVTILREWDETYRPLLESGDYVAGESLWGVEETRGFNFTDDFGVNELLAAVSTFPKPATDSVRIIIAPDIKITQHRVQREFDIDWMLSASMKISFDENDPGFKGWRIGVVIDEDQIDLDSIQIPYGLEVVYSSELTRLLDYHAQRNADIKLKIKEDVPPTSTDLRRELTGGRFE